MLTTYTYSRIGQLVTEKWYDGVQNGNLIAHYKYVYDGNGNIVRSIDFGAEKEYTYTYENGVLARAAEYDITFNTSEIVTGKTDSFGRKEFDELQLNGTGTISRRFAYHEGSVTEEHKEHRKKKSNPTTSLVSRITFADGRTLSYEYDNEERITRVVVSQQYLIQENI